jgi:hypothetical protein
MLMYMEGHGRASERIPTQLMDYTPRRTRSIGLPKLRWKYQPALEWNGTDLKLDVCGRAQYGPIRVLSRHRDGLRKTTDILSQDSRCSCRDSNKAPSEAKSYALLLGPNSSELSLSLILRH